MDSTDKIVLGLIVAITLLGLAAIGNNYYTDKNAMVLGLHQQQAIGSTGYIWVK